MEKRIEVVMGAISKPLSEQLAAFNLPQKTTDQLQKVADSITRLSICGYIPQSQAERCRKKLFKEIQAAVSKHCGESEASA